VYRRLRHFGPRQSAPTAILTAYRKADPTVDWQKRYVNIVTHSSTHRTGPPQPSLFQRSENGNSNGHLGADSQDHDHSHRLQRHGNKRRKLSPACTSCEKVLSRPWACLTCSFVGCRMPLQLGAGKDCGKVHWTAGQCGFGEPLYCPMSESADLARRRHRLGRNLLRRVRRSRLL
jgi:hypothetical protein